MIKQVQKNDREFINFCDRDVFGTRIKVYYNCYSTDYDFVKFWVQTDDDGRITASLSRIDGDVTLCADNCDFDEMSEFLNMVGYNSIQCERTAADKMNLQYSLWGYVVRYKGNDYQAKPVSIKESFELKEIYDIIKSAKLVGVGEYLAWLSDTSFRMNRGYTKALVADVKGKSAGCAMALFSSDRAVLLGAVATVPEFRGRGIAGTLVTMLADEAVKDGRRAELLCKNDSIVEFYKSIGFEVENEWSLIENETNLL